MLDNTLLQNFLSALDTFAALGGKISEPDRQSDLFRAYGRLMWKSEAEDAILDTVFRALIDALDAAPGGEVAEVLYYYAFREFLEAHGGKPVVQAAIREYVEGNQLENIHIRTGLVMRLLHKT